MSYKRTYLSVRGRICILPKTPRICISLTLEIVGVYLLLRRRETCLFRTLNQRLSVLILRNPHPKGLVGVVLLLFEVLYLKRKGGEILIPSLNRLDRQVLKCFDEVSVEEFLDGIFKSKRKFSFVLL